MPFASRRSPKGSVVAEGAQSAANSPTRLSSLRVRGGSHPVSRLMPPPRLERCHRVTAGGRPGHSRAQLARKSGFLLFLQAVLHSQHCAKEQQTSRRSQYPDAMVVPCRATS